MAPRKPRGSRSPGRAEPAAAGGPGLPTAHRDPGGYHASARAAGAAKAETEAIRAVSHEVAPGAHPPPQRGAGRLRAGPGAAGAPAAGPGSPPATSPASEDPLSWVAVCC